MNAPNKLNTNPEPMTGTQEKNNEMPTVKVYDPPSRPALPVWLLLLILALALVTTAALFQAIR